MAENTNNIDLNLTPEELSKQLFASGFKAFEKAQGKQIEEAVAQGTDPRQILSTLIDRSSQLAAQGQTSQQFQGQIAPQPQQQSQQQVSQESNQQVRANPIQALFNALPGGKQRQANLQSSQLSNELLKQQLEGKQPLQVRDIQKIQLKSAIDSSKAGTLDANDILGKFEPVANNFQDIVNSFARVQASIDQADAAGDVALVFNFMKMLDPQSVVREGEFAVAAKAAGLGERLITLAAKIDRGEILSSGQRKMFAGRAEKLFKSQEKQFKFGRKQFSELARKNQIDPDRVLRDVRLQETNFNEELTNMPDEELRRIAGGQ